MRHLDHELEEIIQQVTHNDLYLTAIKSMKHLTQQKSKSIKTLTPADIRHYLMKWGTPSSVGEQENGQQEATLSKNWRYRELAVFEWIAICFCYIYSAPIHQEVHLP